MTYSIEWSPTRRPLLFLLALSSLAGLALAPGARAVGSEGASTNQQIIGQPWIGEPGITETVNQIMARDPFPMPTTGVPWEIHPVGVSPANLIPNPDSPAVSQWPPRVWGPDNGPLIEGGGLRSPQAPGTSFKAIQLSESGFIPPDTQGDVGPDQILTAANGHIKVFDRTGVLGPLNTTTNTFFASVNDGTNVSDPRIVYDRTSQRWFVSIISTHTPDRIEIAVSSGSHISSASSFTFFQFQQDLVGPTPNVDTNNFADYDTLGVDVNALYIGCNMFNPNSYGTTGWVVNKSQLLSGTLVVTAFRGLASSSTEGPAVPQGVTNDDPTATTGFFIGPSNDFYGKLELVTVSNPGGTPSVSAAVGITVPLNYFPTAVPAMGSTDPLDAIDYRLFPARLHHGHLTVGETVSVDSTGTPQNPGDRDGARWYDITNLAATPAVQSGTLFDTAASNPRFFWFPTVVYTGQGHLAMGASAAGAAEDAEIVAAGRLASDPPGNTEAPTTVQTSSTTYNVQTGVAKQRWGDYSATIVDPLDDMTAWTFQEYCDATNSWATRVIQLKAPPPAAPASASPSIAQGQSNVNVTVTGTSAAGSGFFDPDASYPNHIAASVSGTGVTVNSVTYTDPTHITLNLTATASATTGTRNITVINPDGQMATGTGILTVVSGGPPAPAGLSATPANGKVTLNWMSSTGAVTYNVKRSTTSGSGYVTIASPGTTTYTDTSVTNDTTYYYVVSGVNGSSIEGPNSTEVQATPTAKPIIMSFNPTSGHVGAAVTITGDNFTGSTTVKFNGTGASFSIMSQTTINTSVPLGATTGPITVTNASGTGTSATNFTVPAPSGITFTPTAGSLGSMVSISGSGFTGATSVKFNGADSSFSVNSDTSITDFVPYSATTGPISVTTPAGTGTSATNFTVNAPAITSFNPNNGSVNSTVNITGSAFTAASAVKFNGVGANYVLNSDTSITATVPFGATTGPISVTSPAGTGTSATNFTVNPPSITNFSPTSGPIGNFVTLTGSSFTGVTAVKFNGISANFFYSSDTQINATVPPGFVSGLISVITPAGTGTTAALTPANFTVPGPVITNLNPNNGSLRSTVVINGSGFTSASGVKFNGVSANYYINLDSQLVAFVPDTATTGPVTVTTPSGTSAGVTFTVNPPVITGFNPTHGSIGSFVTISGSGFTLASGVKFGGVSASYFVSTDTSISAQVPSGFVSGTISVTGPIGTGTSAGTFTVDAPSITGFSPTHGAAGTNVTVNGSSFTGATSIKFNGVSASLFVSNDGQISTTVPVGATTGPITVTGPGGTGTSATNFAVP